MDYVGLRLIKSSSCRGEVLIVVLIGYELLCAKDVALRIEIERHRLLILWLG
jgi:hypothetical protein